MERREVVSSNIKSVGYDQTNQVLEIEFHSGDIYEYIEVSESLFKQLVNADSIGKYFSIYIRGKYKDKKINN